MTKLTRLSIRTKIILSIVVALIILSLFISYFSCREAELSLKHLTWHHLLVLLSSISGWISDEFSSMKEDVILFSASPSILNLSYNIKALFENAEDQDAFFKDIRAAVLKKKSSGNGILYTNYLLFSKDLKMMTKHYLDVKKKYKNIILIDIKSGYIFFEDTPLEDFGTSLYKDKYRTTPLARVFNKARKLRNGEVLFGEFAENPIYGNELVAFLATPIYKDKKPDSVCVFVVGGSTLKSILQHVTEARREFEVFILINTYSGIIGVGPKGLLSQDAIDKRLVNTVFSGKGGILMEEDANSSREKYVKVYEPLNVFGHRWAVIGQIPSSVVFESAGKLRGTIFYISFITILIFTLLIYLQLNRIIKPIGVLTDTIVKITNKQLPLDTNIEIKTGDEIEILSKSFNKLIQILREQIGTLSKFIEILRGEAENLEVVVDKEKDIVGTQASSITELASTIEEFSKTMESITEINQRALDEFKALKESAMKNYDAQEKVIDGMKDLKDEMRNTFDLFEKIIKMNEDIRGIADIIDSVAEQIKIIAFNASLEAARAGDAGKGFSVIAAQIRELLENISKQNVEIKKLIDENSRNIAKISESSDKISYFLEVEEKNVDTISQFIEDVLKLIKQNEEFISSIFVSQNQQKIAIKEFITSVIESKKKIEEGRKLAKEIGESVAILRELVEELSRVKEEMIK